VTRLQTFRIARLSVLLLSLPVVGPVDLAWGQTRPKTASVTQKRPTARVSQSRLSRARRARIARARARAIQAREAAVPHFKLGADGTLVPDVRAEAAIIYNPDTGQVLWEENSRSQRSIASLTKVMTAAVFLENDPDLSRDVVVERADLRGIRNSVLRVNERLRADDLLNLMLIASDNGAARTLARVSEYGPIGFIQRMNETAAELGLETAHYTDPSGLDAGNAASAYDMAQLIVYASGDERIATAMRAPQYTFRTNRRTVTVNSTNQLVRSGDIQVRAGKTGFISKAGYCLATLLQLPQGNQQVAVVVLGARSNAGRFMETRHLFNWLSSKASELFATPAAAASQ
jgi:D-alanyl-D-alanine endopeptidase (penicillin-binding protein 7)